MTMHLTTLNLKTQVTGEHTVKTVKSTREILKGAASLFQAQSSAQPILPILCACSPQQPPESWSLLSLSSAVPRPVLSPEMLWACLLPLDLKKWSEA